MLRSLDGNNSNRNKNKGKKYYLGDSLINPKNMVKDISYIKIKEIIPIVNEYEYGSFLRYSRYTLKLRSFSCVSTSSYVN